MQTPEFIGASRFNATAHPVYLTPAQASVVLAACEVSEDAGGDTIAADDLALAASQLRGLAHRGQTVSRANEALRVLRVAFDEFVEMMETHDDIIEVDGWADTGVEHDLPEIASALHDIALSVRVSTS